MNNTTSLNDREQQVCKVALLFLLNYKSNSTDFPMIGQLNQFDILEPNHTRAHCITALKKFGVDFATLQKP